MNELCGRFAELFKNRNCPAVVFDSNQLVLYANDSARHLFPEIESGGLKRSLTDLGYFAVADSLEITGFASLQIHNRFGAACSAMFVRENDETLLLVDEKNGDADKARALTKTNRLESSIRSGIQRMLFTIDAIAEYSDNRGADEAIKSLRRMCYTSLRNINNYLLLRRFYSGESAINPTNCNLSSIIRALCETTNAVCVGMPPVHFSCDEETFCRADRRLIELAITNLICNSLIYTRDGNVITVSIKKTGSKVIIIISDRGMGIKPELLGSINEMFESRDPYDDGEPTTGVGLGLPVAGRIARLHGGSLIISGVFGEGTTVTFSIENIPCEDGQTLNAATSAEYLRDTFSPVYVGLSPVCEL